MDRRGRPRCTCSVLAVICIASTISALYNNLVLSFYQLRGSLHEYNNNGTGLSQQLALNIQEESYDNRMFSSVLMKHREEVVNGREKDERKGQEAWARVAPASHASQLVEFSRRSSNNAFIYY